MGVLLWTDFYANLRGRAPVSVLLRSAYIDSIAHQTTAAQCAQYGAIYQWPLSWVQRQLTAVPRLLGWADSSRGPDPADADAKRFLHLPFRHLSDVFVCATLLTGQGVPHEALSVREFLQLLLCRADAAPAPGRQVTTAGMCTQPAQQADSPPTQTGDAQHAHETDDATDARARPIPSVLAHVKSHRDAFVIVVTVQQTCLDGVRPLVMCQCRTMSDVLVASADRCAHCRTPKSADLCPACHRVLYCSRDCRQAHFDAHKEQCAEWQQWQWVQTSDKT